MCHVTNVDKQWNESGAAKADDIRECASAVAVLEEVSSDGIKIGGVKKTLNILPSTSSESSDSSSGDVTDIMKIATQLGMLLKVMLVVAILLTLGMFQYGYVAFVWCTVGSLALFADYNNAYRFGTVVSLVCAQLEAMIRMDQPLEKLACQAINSSNNYVAVQSSKNILLNFMHTAIIGISSGLGFRTGIAVAFSACQHPWETRDTVFQGVTSWTNMATLCLIYIAGGFISLVSYKYCTVNNRWHIRRTVLCCSLMAIIFAVYLEIGCSYRTHCFIFLNGSAMSFGVTWGAIFGRRAVLKYGFEARYVTKKTIGFLIGLYLAYMCGWTLKIPNNCWSSLAFYILSVTAHPLFDLHIVYKIWRAKSAFPIKMIRDQMKAVIKGHPLLETKLSLWDFAGDTLYHCTHHIFMPDRALYVIVFDLEAAVSDEDGQLQTLLFWLHSVCAHARHPDAVVMIVGTHKAKVSDASRKCFTNKLHHLTTSTFCHRLVLNPVDDRPLFLVENSEPLDRDFQQLRAEIFRRVENAEYAQERYPIKYLHFYHEIQDRRKLAQEDCAANVATLKEVEVLARETCDVTGEAQLKKMLRYFCEAGEIIYSEEDEVLRQHVVLDPQFLVDVMKKLVEIPRGSHRSHRYAIEWRNYENSGIISEELFQHIYCDMSHLVPLLTSLLQSYDLMCPVEPIINPNSSRHSFLVPTKLPPFHGDVMKFWESLSSEEVFYFDFGFFDPRTIYYRLLTRCLTQYLTRACLGEVASQPLIFADRCRFHIGTSFIFKLQLEMRSSQQQLISVTLLTFEQENPRCKLLQFLVDAVRSITVRDYSHLNFTFGPRCPFCVDPLSNNELADGLCDGRQDKAIHVLRMAGHDQPFPEKSPVVMFCGVKRYELKLSKLPSLPCSSSQPPQRVAFNLETPITKLPPDLFYKVCRLLNNTREHRNWKTLAGELGKDVESVANLDSEVSNPTESLLHEWTMEGGVTVASLLEVLDRPSLQRKDIIQEVCVQMTQY